MELSQEEMDTILDTINDRAIEIRKLMITIGSIIAILMPAVEMIGIIDLTPYGEGDDEWVTDDDWESGSDFRCGGGMVIEWKYVDDGFKHCQDGSDEDPDYIADQGGDPAPIIYGCTDPDAMNYQEEADQDDDSCEYDDPDQDEIWGCTDPDAENYWNEATHDDGSCEYYKDPEEESCNPETYDAYWWTENETNETVDLIISWDADISGCQETVELNVIWTIYENETGNWTGFQDELEYETTTQDWDYYNMTFTQIPFGKYDIFSTYQIHDEYFSGVEWYGIEI